MKDAAQANVDPEDVPRETEETRRPDKVELTVVESDGGGPAQTSVKTARFAPLGPGVEDGPPSPMDLLLDVQLELSVELGRTALPVRDVLQLGPGSIVELNKLGGEPVDVLVNGRPIARGEVVVVDENFGVRVTEIVNREQGTLRQAQGDREQ